MKMLATLIVLLVPTSILFAQPADLISPVKPDGLPVAAKQAIERHDKAVDAAKKAYDAALAKAAADARKDLEKILDTETRAGRLESALAVKARMELLAQPGGAGTAAPAAAPAATPASTELPKAYQALVEKVQSGTLTEAEWKGLPGQKLPVDSKKVLDTGIMVKKGEVYLVVPNPGDKWFGSDTMPALDYRGDLTGKLAIYKEAMRLLVKLNRTSTIKNYVVDEEGEITLNANDHYLADNRGVIDVKVIRVK